MVRNLNQSVIRAIIHQGDLPRTEHANRGYNYLTPLDVEVLWT